MAKPLNHGDVVLVPFPFSDLSGTKVRPAVVISADPQTSELILAFITSVLTNRSPRGAEVELLRTDAEFRTAGLKGDSLVRLDKLVTLSSSMISRRLGKAGAATQTKIAAALRRSLNL
ncbi:MAG TPA: type II toxin-antitoxin system PemK/MazF family toxin [Humisphaera sp.]|jgi:mRNA interferase MazF|nr:type II toxin-antitoxin system PemK/MazF family toxin [Humisphaera sp.]